MPKMKWVLFAVLLTTIGLVAAACGGDDPTPTPTKVPTKAPVAVATATAGPVATPTATPNPRTIDPPEATQVNLLASLSFMAEIVEPMRRILEEQGSPVTMTVEDFTGGPSGGFALFNNQSLAERKITIPWSLENDYNFAVAATSPRFPDGVKGGALVLLKVGPLGCSGEGTLEESIVNFADLDGKTLQDGSRPSARARDGGDALGIDINHVEHGGDDVTVRELKNGQVDASYYHMTGHNRPVPQLLQLLQERDGAFYHIDVADAVNAIHDKYPGKWPFMFPVPLFAGDLQKTWSLGTDPIRGDVAHCFGGQNPYFTVSADMDDAVAYEIVYQVIKNREDFGRFLAGDVEEITSTLGMTYVPQAGYHPGARQAFEDLGYPYGLEDTIQYQRARAEAKGLPLTISPAFEDLITRSRGLSPSGFGSLLREIGEDASREGGTT